MTSMTMRQVAEFSAKRKETWIVIDDQVHNVTAFLNIHPGGELVISNMKNKDCSLVFENYHFTKLTYARALLKRHCPIVGTLVVAGVVSSPSSFDSGTNGKGQQTEKNQKKKNSKNKNDHVQHFRAIQQELYNTGMFQVNDAFYYKLYVWLVFLFTSSLYLTLLGSSSSTGTGTGGGDNNDSIYSHMLGAVLMGCFWQQLAGLGHDLGHTNVSRNYQRDHLSSSIIGCSLSGISNAWWKKNHNTHHVVCNSIEHDPDIQHLPTFAVSPLIIQSPYFSSYYQKWFSFVFSSNDSNDKKMTTVATAATTTTTTSVADVLANVEAAAARFMISYQHYFLIPIMLVARFNMYAQSWLFLLNRHQNKTAFRYHEIAALLFFAAWYSAVSLSLPTYAQSVAWILTSHAVAGILHIQIIISHWAMETYRDDDDDRHQKSKDENDDKKKNDGDMSDVADTTADIDDWYTLQLKTSMNIDCPAWMDWFHFGLQYQVEHHLYPSLPRHSLRHASRLVQRACAEHGIPYHHDSFYGALCKTLSALRETALVAQQGKNFPNKNTKNVLVDALNCNG
jgi:acyl-lipid Delta6-acetylenase / acyl-lipid (9-3)-desaturase